jgi:hypothetical protein
MNSGSSPSQMTQNTPIIPNNNNNEKITSNLLISNHIYYGNKCSAPAPSR